MRERAIPTPTHESPTHPHIRRHVCREGWGEGGGREGWGRRERNRRGQSRTDGQTDGQFQIGTDGDRAGRTDRRTVSEIVLFPTHPPAERLYQIVATTAEKALGTGCLFGFPQFRVGTHPSVLLPQPELLVQGIFQAVLLVLQHRAERGLLRVKLLAKLVLTWRVEGWKGGWAEG